MYDIDEGFSARVGSPAPMFHGTVFHNGEMRPLKLSELAGKWVVLFFYPADFTFVCPTELGGLADKYAELQKMGVEVVTCSTDTEWSHKVWADVSPVIKKIAYPMMADPTGEVSSAYGVYDADSGLADRGRFIIDPDGILKSMEITAEPLGRNVDEIIRQISALDFIRNNPGQACPMSWKIGDKTLTPGIDLAGKI
ncbi:peroxiredoxin [Candidatus Peregrinibacteria bacterium]|nr:MAG: peroxiredoxin [Candidatus Peregrinibacteria bacterium]